MQHIPAITFLHCSHAVERVTLLRPLQKVVGGRPMKSLIKTAVVAALIATPFAALAQSGQPLTRAQVREELIQLEKAGYNPQSRANNLHYPDEIQAALARVAAQGGTSQATGVGGVDSSASQAGRRAETSVSTYSPPIYVNP